MGGTGTQAQLPHVESTQVAAIEGLWLSHGRANIIHLNSVRNHIPTGHRRREEHPLIIQRFEFHGEMHSLIDDPGYIDAFEGGQDDAVGR